MVCRLCFCESDDYIEIFSEEMIHKHIKKFLDLELNEQDPVSNVICVFCLQHLKNFTNFYFRVKEAQQKLQIKCKKEINVMEEDDEPFEYVNTEPDYLNGDQDQDQDQEINIGEEEILEQSLPDLSDDKSTSTTIASSRNDPDYNNKVPRKRKHTVKNAEDKKCLAQLMQHEELIWNQSHKLHNNSVALSEAWSRIASMMPGSKTVEECKAIWRSMRDALRYKKRQKLCSKTWDKHSGEDDFRNMLSFLTIFPNRRKKQTSLNSNDGQLDAALQSPHKGPAPAEVLRKEDGPANFTGTNSFPTAFGCPNNSLSNGRGPLRIGETNITPLHKQNKEMPPFHFPSSSYSYANMKNHIKDEVPDLVESISKALNRLVTIATSEVQQIKSSHFEFKYEYIWKLIESLYAQMDTPTINDVNQQIIDLVYNSLKKLNSKTKIG